MAQQRLAGELSLPFHLKYALKMITLSKNANFDIFPLEVSRKSSITTNRKSITGFTTSSDTDEIVFDFLYVAIAKETMRNRA